MIYTGCRSLYRADFETAKETWEWIHKQTLTKQVKQQVNHSRLGKFMLNKWHLKIRSFNFFIVFRESIVQNQNTYNHMELIQIKVAYIVFVMDMFYWSSAFNILEFTLQCFAFLIPAQFFMSDIKSRIHFQDLIKYDLLQLLNLRLYHMKHSYFFVTQTYEHFRILKHFVIGRLPHLDHCYC